MLHIKPSQIQAFEAASATTFPDRLLAFLRESFPEREDDLRDPEAIASPMARARELEMVGERDVCKFVALSLTLGDGFDVEPWATAILQDPCLAEPTERVDALFAAARDRQLKSEADALASGMRE